MEQLIRQGRDPNDINKRFGCSRRTVKRAINRILGFGSLEDPKLHCKKGPKFKFTAQMKEELGWLLIQPTIRKSCNSISWSISTSDLRNQHLAVRFHQWR